MEVTLVSMPFGFFNRPALGISLLRGALLRDGIDCDIHYLQLSFAKMIGPDLYRQIAQRAPRTLLGEWLFAQALFGDLLPAPQTYIDEELRSWGIIPQYVAVDEIKIHYIWWLRCSTA